jgi:hypothetical protein
MRLRLAALASLCAGVVLAQQPPAPSFDAGTLANIASELSIAGRLSTEAPPDIITAVREPL